MPIVNLATPRIPMIQPMCIGKKATKICKFSSALKSSNQYYTLHTKFTNLITQLTPISGNHHAGSAADQGGGGGVHEGGGRRWKRKLDYDEFVKMMLQQ